MGPEPSAKEGFEKCARPEMGMSCNVLVAAAGRGSRAGLPYPKTLYPVRGRPIIVRLLETLKQWDPEPTVIVSPAGLVPISDCLKVNNLSAHLVIQEEPTGMGDAVLCYQKSPAFPTAENVLLVWGDIPLIQPSTIEAMVTTHLFEQNDFTFATAYVDHAYTRVQRDNYGNVIGIIETHEVGIDSRMAGERDVGLFVFRRDSVMDLLNINLAGRIGGRTGEHGFLYLVEHLASRGRRVAAVPIATPLDLVSLNSLSDLGDYA